MVKQQRRNKKGERDVQGCNIDQSRGDAQGVKERKKKKRRKHMEERCMCASLCVQPQT